MVIDEKELQAKLRYIVQHNTLVAICYNNSYDHITNTHNELQWLRQSIILLDAQVQEVTDRLIKHISLSTTPTPILVTTKEFGGGRNE